MLQSKLGEFTYVSLLYSATDSSFSQIQLWLLSITCSKNLRWFRTKITSPCIKRELFAKVLRTSFCALICNDALLGAMLTYLMRTPLRHSLLTAHLFRGILFSAHAQKTGKHLYQIRRLPCLYCFSYKIECQYRNWSGRLIFWILTNVLFYNYYIYF